MKNGIYLFWISKPIYFQASKIHFLDAQISRLITHLCTLSCLLLISFGLLLLLSSSTLKRQVWSQPGHNLGHVLSPSCCWPSLPWPWRSCAPPVESSPRPPPFVVGPFWTWPSSRRRSPPHPLSASCNCNRKMATLTAEVHGMLAILGSD